MSLTDYVDRIPELLLVGSNTSSINAIKDIHNGAKPEIIFLGIEMPQLCGLQAIESLPRSSAIILLTSEPKYALDAYEKDVVDFLLKPILFDRFLKATMKAVDFLQKCNAFNHALASSFLYINPGTKGKVIQVAIKSIQYIEADDHFICINTSLGVHRVKSTMSQICAKLPLQFFARIHRSFIININFIESVAGDCIYMKNKKKFVTGDVYKKNFSAMLYGKGLHL